MRLAIVDDESVYRNHIAELIYAVPTAARS